MPFFNITFKKLLQKINCLPGFNFVRSSNIALERKTVRRSLLYVPGHDVKKIEKLNKIKVDCAVLDCEDGVGVDW